MITAYLKKIIPESLLARVRPLYHFLLTASAAVFYGFPSRRIRVIGVTGTKGKTTVVELIHKILEEADFGVSSVSSLRFRAGRDEGVNERKMTMPGRFFVQKFLYEAVRAGHKYAIIEVTSEGIKQFRHRFINFDTAILTNVSPEHIEAHGGFEKYLRAKLDLFWRLPKRGTAVINYDDPNFKRFSAATSARKIFYGKDGVDFGDKKNAVRHLLVNKGGIEFEVGGVKVSSPLLGEFNFYNILAATTLGINEHISLEKISSAIVKVSGIKGRMEFVQKEPFSVVVDYAHTPDSLGKVYSLLRSYQLPATNHKLICVLGAAGGGRDKWKRPEFGKIAAEFCDEVILTNEDPYDEIPQMIIEDIERGISTSYTLQATRFKKIIDRRKAIHEALRLAKTGDTVVITGKGAEPWIMGPGGERTPWDDRKVVKEELRIIK